MKFVDNATIKITAGKGGDGCLSFRREKYIPDGGPDGGDGGDGGSIYLVGDESLNTLSEFRYNTLYKAKNGSPGEGSNKKGKSAPDLYINMPLGTKVLDVYTDEIIGEILTHKEQLLVAKGGFHGIGNARFKSSINRAPRQTTKGTLGEVRELGLELMIMADVATLGKPNAGKSSLIRQITSSKPKIADYPFTTLHPSLGVVNAGSETFVIADIPGLLENASQGVGLGDEFLKHLSRAKILLHIVDIAPIDGTTAIENYNIIESELKKFSEELYQKPRLVVINKIDTLSDISLIEEFKRAIDYTGEILEISAINGKGCRELIFKIQAEITALKEAESTL